MPNRTPLEEMDEAIACYKRGSLPAREALRIYFKLNIANDWRRVIDPSEVRKIFQRSNGEPMTRSTFWRVINQLQEEGEIDFDEPASITIKRVKPR